MAIHVHVLTVSHTLALNLQHVQVGRYVLQPPMQDVDTEEGCGHLMHIIVDQLCQNIYLRMWENIQKLLLMCIWYLLIL